MYTVRNVTAKRKAHQCNSGALEIPIKMAMRVESRESMVLYAVCVYASKAQNEEQRAHFLRMYYNIWKLSKKSIQCDIIVQCSKWPRLSAFVVSHSLYLSVFILPDFLFCLIRYLLHLLCYCVCVCVLSASVLYMKLQRIFIAIDDRTSEPFYCI